MLVHNLAMFDLHGRTRTSDIRFREVSRFQAEYVILVSQRIWHRPRIVRHRPGSYPVEHRRRVRNRGRQQTVGAEQDKRRRKHHLVPAIRGTRSERGDQVRIGVAIATRRKGGRVRELNHVLNLLRLSARGSGKRKRRLRSRPDRVGARRPKDRRRQRSCCSRRLLGGEEVASGGRSTRAGASTGR
jgi:hypothetical protein